MQRDPGKNQGEEHESGAHPDIGGPSPGTSESSPEFFKMSKGSLKIDDVGVNISAKRNV